MRGDIEDALATWRAASNEIPAGAGGALEAVEQGLELRLALVGRPAPDVATKDYVGGEPEALSARKGRVVVLDFWATWCPPCREVIPELDRLYEAKHAAGLDVIGVTRFCEQGYLPASPDQLQSGGEEVRGLDEVEFHQHLVDFHRNAKIGYPFAIAQPATFDAYRATTIPTLVIVDRAGTVWMVVVGSDQAILVRAIVDRLLTEKAG